MGSINLLPEQVSHYRKIHEGGRLRSESAKCRAPLLKESAGSYKAQIFWFGFYLTYCQDYSKKVWSEYAKCRAPLLREPAGSDELLRLNCATPLIE